MFLKNIFQDILNRHQLKNNNNYHIYFRLWFAHKRDIQKNSALAYRSETEICFESTATSTKIVRRAPTKYDEVLISPPATSNSTQFEIGRYISDRQLISFPDIQDYDQAVLVVLVVIRLGGVGVSPDRLVRVPMVGTSPVERRTVTSQLKKK